MSLPILDAGGFFGGLGKGLGAGLQQANQSIAEMFTERKKAQEKQKMIQSILNPPQQIGVSEKNYDNLFGNQNQQSKFEITPEKILQISSIDPAMGANLSRIYAGQEKQRIQQEEENQEKQIGQESFNRMAELLKKGNLGFGSEWLGKAFGGQRAEDVGEFSSLSGALESMLVDRVSRGTLSNARFKYITETLLPKPGDREATIRGKLKALSRELNLDPSALGLKSKKEKENVDFVIMQTPDGKKVKVPRNKIIEAQKAGGKLVK